MENLSIRKLKISLIVCIILLVSWLIYIVYLLQKEPIETTVKQVINRTTDEKDSHSSKPFGYDKTSQKIDKSTQENIRIDNVAQGNISREIVPESSALQKDARLNQTKIATFDENKIKVPNINRENFHSTFGRKVVLIYFSHNRESFLPYFKERTPPESAYHSKLNVSLIGQRLGKTLKQNGIWNKVSNMDIIKILNERNLNFDSSYQMSREIVINEMRMNRDLKMAFDIHRDALPRNLSTTNINGQSFAKISFVIGKEHEHYKENLEFINDINGLVEKEYPGLSRGIIVKDKKQGNGVYNQDLLPNSVIIEVGGVENNLEELYRTADVLGNVISQYYWENIH